MTIDFTTVLKDQDDQPLKDMFAMQTNGGVEVDLTLGRVASHSLMIQGQDDQNLSGEDKFSRGALAFKIRDNSSADLKAEDIVLIKKQIAKLYSPVVVYRSYPLLDNAEKNDA